MILEQIYVILGLIFIILIISGVIWIWGRIGRKCGEGFWNYGLGMFIPIWNLFLLVKLAKKPKLWVLAFFVPVVNVIIWAIVHGLIAERLQKGFWLNAIGSCIPGLNIGLLISLAVSKT